MRKILLLIIFCITCISNGIYAQDKFLDLLKDELSIQFSKLKEENYPPYYMHYRVIDKEEWYISSSFGSEMNRSHNHIRSMIPQIRIGNTECDNFINNPMGMPKPSVAVLPIDDINSENAIRQAIWKETNERYKIAVNQYQNDLTKEKIKVKREDNAPCFSDVPVEKYYEDVLSAETRGIDIDKWSEKLKEISSTFKSTQYINNGDATLTYRIERRYFVDTDGREIVQNLPYARIMVSAYTTADDGMILPLNLSYFAYNPKDLPDTKTIIEDTKKMITKLGELKNAPIVSAYTAPAMLSGKASGVFFHEIFGHRVEGLRMKSDSDGQTFKKMVGKELLPKDIQVYDDPTLKSYNNSDLNGYYKFDDQGIRAERVNVIQDGVLHDFLMTRTPIDGHPRSNGHARGEGGFDPVSRQSNLIIETKSPKTFENLKELLIEEAKRQGKEFGFFFKEVTGGLTYTGKGSINSFNVTPLEVYKVYVDGRPDELVRGVDLIGTPLSMFSNILHIGDDPEIFTGMCGAESGSIPVTAISPTIMVSSIEVQRKNKSQELPPILPRP